jgi:epsin
MNEIWRWTKIQLRKTSYTLTGKTDAEKVVYEATNSDPWGPSNTQMQQISQMSLNYSDLESIKNAIWERTDNVQEIRIV